MEPNWWNNREIRDILVLLGISGAVVGILLLYVFTIYQW